jgi:diguanylate cyclase (GGDEF)-like protein
MQWDIVPEILSSLVIFIILVNSRDAKAIPSMRDKLFRFSLHYMIFCTIVNIISILSVYHFDKIPLWVNMLTNTAFFTLYPPLPVIFILYILLYVYESVPVEHMERFRLFTIILITTVLAFLIIVVLNFSTGWIFSFDAEGNYIRGPLNQLSLVIAVFQIGVALVAIWLERKYLDRMFFKVILWMPPLSFAIIVLQMLFPTIVLTGTAMMVAMLSVYLNFQTRRISIDDLTQFPNRDSFIVHIDQLKRHNRKAVVLLVSLDDFKFVNDTYGQKRGNLMLRAVAQGLQDLASHGQTYRYGGDEFAIISNGKHGQNLAESVRNRFGESWYVEGVSTRLRASMALLDLPFRPDPSIDPLNLLDHAIRTAKNRGKEQLVYCDSMLLRTIRRKNQLSERLLQAIEQETLSVDYQPIFSFSNKRMEMAEALLRWEDPQLGKVSPVEFIPLAEELGVIDELGRWVLEQTCAMLDEMRAGGIPIPSISVNFSGLQFSDPHVLKGIMDILDRYRIPTQTINIELTESSLIGTSFNEALALMNKLISNGLRLHLDDFGTGYSNLSRMVNLPFHCIKLDKSLLWSAKKNEKMLKFVDSIIKIVGEMGFRFIVEGVETEDQVVYLKQITCDLVQGYYFSPPLPKEQFITYINAQKNLK